MTMEEQTQLERLYESADQLIDDCHAMSASVIEPCREAAFLYFIVRYKVSVHESRYGEIPIQVLNEYKNALDHYFRFLSKTGPEFCSDEDDSKNLHKMRGHLQRACLDVLKIFCHHSHDQIEDVLNRYSVHVLELVDNRSFYPAILTTKNQAHKLFEKAKISDLSLGENAKNNEDVLRLYLEAAFAYDEIVYTLLSKEESVAAAQITHDGISSKASKHSTKHEFGLHFAVKVVWGIGGLGLMYLEYKFKLIDLLKGLMG